MNNTFYKTKPFFLLSFFIVLLSCVIFFKFKKDVNALKETYITEKSLVAQDAAQKIENKIHIAYQTVRTISFLPGVMKIEKRGDTIGEEGVATIQQLYNNAFGDIKLSEIYVVAKDFNPEHLDPVTKKGDEPIAVFDEFIVGNPPKKEETTTAILPEVDKLEEVEEFEYKLIKHQINYFIEHHSLRSSFKEIDVPLMTGPEVVTCDNSEFSKDDLDKKNDFPRIGLVLSVPKYDIHGKFNGVVSTVLRTKTILSYIPPKYYGLINQENQTYMIDAPSDEWKQAAEDFKKSNASTQFIFSKKFKINFNDISPWELWVTFPDNLFYESTGYKSLLNFFIFSLFGIILFGAFFLFYFYKSFKNNFLTIKVISDLSEASVVLMDSAKSVNNSSAAVTTSSREQARSTEEIASAVVEISSMSQNTKDNVGDLQSISEESLKSSSIAKNSVVQLGNALELINKNEHSIVAQIEENNQKMQEILSFITEISNKTKVIDDIVFQTKLLSFNASVEAARAGEQGKGFSVVAEEVGKLAHSSGDAAKEINLLLKEGVEKINLIVAESNEKIRSLVLDGSKSMQEGDRLSKDCIEQLNHLTVLSEEVQSKVREISGAISQQYSSLAEIERSSNQFSHAINETAEISSSNTVIAEKMLEQSVSIMESLKNLKKIV
jgi:methyl-accepting chemotaxis protein